MYFILSFLQLRLRALRNLLESVSHGEDIVKVHEARLTEKDTTSLSPGEVEDYIMYLKVMVYVHLWSLSSNAFYSI